MSQLGQVLEGKYRVIRRLGEGRAAVVYEVRRIDREDTVAAKILRPEFAADADFCKRWIGRAWAASATAHPGVVEVFDAGTSPDGRPFLVTERLVGACLSEHLSGGARLPPGQAVEIAVHLLTVLGAVHRRGLFHGNLEPSNVCFVRLAEGSDALKLCDFGVPMRTADGRWAGAVNHLAPELLAGRDDADTRADLYSVGAILYHGITGRLPYGDGEPSAVAARILTEPFPPPRDEEPSIHPALERVVLRATSRFRDDRPESADELIRLLSPFLPAEARAQLGVPSVPEPPEPETGRTSVADLAAAAAAPPAAPAEPGDRRRAAPDRPESGNEGAGGGAEEAEEKTEEDGEHEEGGAAARPVPREHTGWSPAAVAAVAAGPAALLGIVLLLVFRGEPPASRPIMMPYPVAAGPAGVGTAVPPEPPPAVEAATVTVSFGDLPPGAAVRVGGRPVAGGTTVLARGDDPVEVQVEAPGYEPFLDRIRPQRDLAVMVAMTPAVVETPPVEGPPVAPDAAGGELPARDPGPPAVDAETPAVATAPPAVDPDARRPPRPPREEPAARDAGPPETSPVEPVAGQLRMLCSPWARVAIPGHGTRNTPFTLDLSPGTYNLVLVNNSNPDAPLSNRITVAVASGDTAKVTECWRTSVLPETIP